MGKIMKIVSRIYLITVLLFSFSLFFTEAPLCAELYPTKQIEMVVGFNPGSATDIVARAFANVARKYIPQPIIVVNKSAGSGAVANEYVINAKPDGYTILCGMGGDATITPHMQDLPHNPVFSLKPVIHVTETPIVLATKGDSPFNKPRDIIEYAKANPGKVSYAATAGGFTQIVPELFAMKGGVKFVFVPSTGSGASLTSAMGGHTTLGSITPSVAAGPYKAGKIKIIGISSEERNKALPGAPTFKEEGFDIVMGSCKGITVPKETPDHIVNYLHAAFKKCIQDPEFVDFMDKAGEPITYKDPKDFKRYLETTHKIAGQIVESLGMGKKK